MKKFTLLLFCFTVVLFSVKSQNIAINSTGAAPAASAMLDITSTTSGLLIPRMTQAQRNAIAAPATGLIIYQTNAVPGFYYYDGTQWLPLLSSATGWSITGNAGTTFGTNFLGTTDAQGVDFRTNNNIRFRIPNADQVHANANGSAALPFYSWNADTDIGMYRVTTNTLGFSTAGVERFRLGTTEAVFNDGSSNYDFRVESDGNANMFFVDGANDRVGIKMGAPANTFDLDETAAIGATDAGQFLISGATGGALDAMSTNAANGYSSFEAVNAGAGQAIFGIQTNTSNNAIAINGQTAAANDRWGLYSLDNLVALALFQWSDGSLKRNISPINSALSSISKLNPVTYNWKEDNQIMADPTALNYGFIAQEVDKVFPDLVAKNAGSSFNPTEPDKDISGRSYEYSAVNYVGLIPVLTKAIQEQQLLIENQNKKIEELQKAVELLQQK
jgi:hypothetical protein